MTATRAGRVFAKGALAAVPLPPAPATARQYSKGLPAITHQDEVVAIPGPGAAIAAVPADAGLHAGHERRDDDGREDRSLGPQDHAEQLGKASFNHRELIVRGEGARGERSISETLRKFQLRTDTN